MTLVLKINSVDQSSSIDWTTVVKTEVLTKEVDRLEFAIKKTGSKTIPNLNDDIVLLEDGVKIYGGVIVEKNDKIIGGLLIGYDIKCKDYSHLLDGKLVTKKYKDQEPKNIVLDIISKFTSGFTTVNVNAFGATVKTIKFNYEQVSRALTQLADQIGWDWYVDSDKDIHFFSAESSPAPFNINDTNGNFEFKTLEINQTIVNLKNSIFILGGMFKRTYGAANAYDVYKGDGVKTVFPLAFSYDNATIEVNGVTKLVGTDQQTDPATVDVLYNFNEKFIKFTTSPPNGAVVKMYGDANVPTSFNLQDTVSIAAYGEFQQAVIDKSITSLAEAKSKARAELDKYAASVQEGRFKTIKTGLKTGQKITINSTIRGITKTFKINRIVGKARGFDHMEYEVFLLASGQMTFTDVMVGLLTKDNKNLIIEDNAALQRFQASPDENVVVADALPTPTKKAPPYNWGPGGANQFTWGLFTWG